jgi:NADPH:quinone reductase-like Zn-dependent oxidoreductase
MKAVVLYENGDIDKLKYIEDFPIPSIKSNEVLVNVKATSVNRIDLLIRNGYPGLNLRFPHIIGGDITGIISETGKDVKNFKVGDRVISWPIIIDFEDKYTKNNISFLSPLWKYFGMHLSGSYAEYVAVPESSLIKLPYNVSFEDAACLPVSGLTAYHAISTVANLKNDENFFIWGGASGLGVIAVQIANSLGANVFATCGSEVKMEYLRKLGVSHVFNHYENQNISEEVMKITNGYGIDTLIDYIGPLTFNQSFNMLRRGGKLLWCGIMTGRETNVSIHMTYLKHISILGLYLGMKSELEKLVILMSEGKVKPHIWKVFELKDAGKAHSLLQEGKIIGKVVLKI